MQIKKELGLLEKSKKFLDWRKKNRENYLSYALFISGEEQERLEIGYYDKKKDNVTTFCITGCDKEKRKIDIRPEENVFKEPDMEVEGLKIDDVRIDIADVLSVSQKLQKEKYCAEIPVKLIIILQKLEPYGQIYNVTYVTQSFNTLNMKINAENGGIVEDHLVSLIQLPEKQP